MQIGRPLESNPFRNIKKMDVKGDNSEDLASSLNRLAGDMRDSKRFVDKNKHNKLDKNTFIKLLSTQLANQDPLNPTTQKQFAADLAQFSQVEQLSNLNNNVAASAVNIPNQIKFMGASFLGKEVLTKGTTIEHTGKTQDINLPFVLNKPAKKVIVNVLDKFNSIVRKLDLGSRGVGAQSAIWDGLTVDGGAASKGKYRYNVIALDDQHNQFTGKTKAQGVVTGVSFDRGEVVLTLQSGEKVYLRDVEDFSLPSSMQGKANNAALSNNMVKEYND